jgi:hypothetical protein
MNEEEFILVTDTNFVISYLLKADYFHEKTKELVNKENKKFFIINQVEREVINKIMEKLSYVVEILLSYISQNKKDTKEIKREISNIKNKIVDLKDKKVDIAYYKNIIISFLDYVEFKDVSELNGYELLKLVNEFREELISLFNTTFSSKLNENKKVSPMYFKLLNCIKTRFLKNNKKDVDKDFYIISELIYYSEIEGRKLKFLTYDKTLKEKFEEIREKCDVKNLEIVLLIY